MSTSQINQKQTDVLSLITANMHREDFSSYMGFCVKKWKRLEVDLQIIDAIISSICKQWSVSKESLVADKKLAEPRAMMYYVIKRQVNLSYGEIGEMFRISKSYIKKSVDDIAFIVEKKDEKKELSKTELLILTAKGDSNNEDVRKARRVLETRGINWMQDEDEKDMISIFRCIQNELSEKNIEMLINEAIKS